jgi:protein-S-isoprenylcysteine O-methyltransferase Ste14
MSAILPAPLVASLYCWFALEVGLAVRDIVRRKGRLRRDRGTKLIVSLSLGVSVAVGLLSRRWLSTLDTPAPVAFAVAGFVTLWAGLALRVCAVVTLGGSFRTSVEVDPDQSVVTRGPYRWVRHPAYTGLLLIALGIGLGAGNWLALVSSAVVPVLGLLPRIRVEESEMTGVLGEPYRRYQATTHRLIPGLW